MKRTPILAALLLLGSASLARAQDVPPPPPPPDTADTGSVTPSGTADTGTTLPPDTTTKPAHQTDENADLRAEVAALKEQVRLLQQRLDAMPGVTPAPTATPTTPAAPEGTNLPAPPAEAVGAPLGATESTPAAPVAATTSAGRALLLPDLSFIGTMIGHVSTDKRDTDRSRFLLDSGEIAIQSYVYPSIKAEAYLTADRENDLKLGVEEAYLTALHLAPHLSGTFGRHKVPFGRVNQLHPHSWLYITQPYALKDLVASESLTGDGAGLSYLLPTKGALFAQLDAGLWSGAEPGTIQPPGTEEIRSGPGAAFEDRFQTLRLWTGTNVGENGEFELGLSGAHGKGQSVELSPGVLDRPEVTLGGLDLSYRHYGTGTSRTLLRGEYIWHHAKSDLMTDTAKGFYVLADHRFDNYRDAGLRYDWSEFPYAPGLHEAALSGIFTHALTEQTYLRLQLTHGNRPGKQNFNEAWLEWVWGVGPHTHNLE